MEPAATPVTQGFDPAQLIERFQVGVWRYLRALGCSPSEADDLTQDTFLAVLRSQFVDRGPASTAAYLRKTARNLWVSAHRRAGRVIAVEDVEPLDRAWERWAGQDHGEARLEALTECLDELTERARKALDLRYREGASRARIAAALGIGEHGAKNLMQRAKQQLRVCIEGKLR